MGHPLAPTGRDYERLPETLADLHVIALVCIMLRQAVNYIAVHNSLRIFAEFRMRRHSETAKNRAA